MNIAIIKKPIDRLDDRAFSELAAWFIEYEHARWDHKILANSTAGKLDFLIDEAHADLKAGKTKPL